MLIALVPLCKVLHHHHCLLNDWLMKCDLSLSIWWVGYKRECVYAFVFPSNKGPLQQCLKQSWCNIHVSYLQSLSTFLYSEHLASKSLPSSLSLKGLVGKYSFKVWIEILYETDKEFQGFELDRTHWFLSKRIYFFVTLLYCFWLVRSYIWMKRCGMR